MRARVETSPGEISHDLLQRLSARELLVDCEDPHENLHALYPGSVNRGMRA